MSRDPIRLAPYADAHRGSLDRGMRRGLPPRGLDSLLGWFRNRWNEELPVRLHVPGVWHDKEAWSALGAPDDAPPWRRYLYGDARTTDHDDYYACPLRAALRRMWGTGSDTSTDAASARWLTIIAFEGFDCHNVGSRHGLDDGTMGLILTESLERLWTTYSPQPIPRASREAVDARAAEVG
jgi:hypothetical protein